MNVIDLLTDVEDAYRTAARELAETDPENSARLTVLADAMNTAWKAVMQQIPQETEIEGGGNSWWFVCPECHGGVIKKQGWCQNCGQRLKWSELNINH